LVLVSIEASCAITVCNAIGGLSGLLTSASEDGARNVDADVSMGEDRSGDVGRAVEADGGNAIEEGVEAISSNLVATRSEMHN
jgi:hypothetical protein